MQKWIDILKNHRVHNTIKNLKTSLNKIDHDKMDEDIEQERERLSMAIKYVEHSLHSALPYLVDQKSLNTINEELQKVLSNLDSFIQNNNVNHLYNANDEITRAIQSANEIPKIDDYNKEEPLNLIISNFLENANNAITSIKEKKKDFEKRAVELTNHVLALEKDLEGVQNTLKNEQDKITTLSTEYQKQFSQSQEKNIAEFAKRLSEAHMNVNSFRQQLDKEVKEKTKEVQTVLDEQVDKLTLEADTAVDNIANKDQQATKILESVGIKTHTFGYAAASRKDGWATFWLRLFATLLMLVAVGILIWPALDFVISNSKGVFDWKGLLYRIPVSIIVFIPAFYLASEAAKHRKEHVVNKRIELELSALNPYLGLLNDDDTNEIKTNLVTNYFVGHSINDNSKPEKDFLTESLPPIIEKIVEGVMSRFNISEKK